jgi:hypothetical protein
LALDYIFKCGSFVIVLHETMMRLARLINPIKNIFSRYQRQDVEKEEHGCRYRGEQRSGGNGTGDGTRASSDTQEGRSGKPQTSKG